MRADLHSPSHKNTSGLGDFLETLTARQETSEGGSHWAKARKAKHPKGGDPEEWPANLRIREFPEVSDV
jgi:hypothetical protein